MREEHDATRLIIRILDAAELGRGTGRSERVYPEPIVDSPQNQLDVQAAKCEPSRAPLLPKGVSMGRIQLRTNINSATHVIRRNSGVVNELDERLKAVKTRFECVILPRRHSKRAFDDDTVPGP